ncbi:MAG: thiamine phosphate synthase [Planctomycetota bacterium]
MADNDAASQDVSVLRVLDAAANRATEGLRTAEDYTRFVLNDSLLTSELKSLRHDLQSVLAEIDLGARLRSRDVRADCGTDLSLDSERQRAELGAVVSAAMERTQQSLRSIEEFSKVGYPAVSMIVEQLRYRCYTLASAVRLSLSRSDDRLHHARLYGLIDCGAVDGLVDWETQRQRIERLFAAGCDVLQMRDKRADDATLYRFAVMASGIARKMNRLFIVNDRADLALAVDADGVHMGQTELPASAVRRVIGPNRLLGISTHNIDDVRAAVLDGADYIGCGPTFPSRTKSFAEFPGLDFLRQVAETTTLPAFAIGGIQVTNIAEIADTGIRRVAVTAAISGTDEGLSDRVAALRKGIESTGSHHSV